MKKFKFGEQFGLKTAIALSTVAETWNGYVGLPPTHLLYGVGSDGFDDLVNVHGGVTWVDNHLPNQQPDGNWWIGFDTAHAGDAIPGFDNLTPEVKARINMWAKQLVSSLLDVDALELPNGVECEDEIRDLAYVTAETSYLASQLSGLKSEEFEREKRYG